MMRALLCRLKRSRARRLIVCFANAMLFVLSGWGAYLLRFDFRIPHAQIPNLLFALPLWVVVKTAMFCAFGLHRGVWRFVSSFDAIRIISANIAGAVASTALILSYGPHGFPRSIYLIDCALALLLTAGAPIAIRLAAELPAYRRRRDTEPAFIYGAGAAAIALLREVRSNPRMGYSVCGFIDDNPSKTGVLIQGVPVLGDGQLMPKLACKYGVHQILIAIPSATGQQMAAILGRCAEAKLSVRTMPALSEMLAGARPTVREVEVIDVLGRAPVRLDEADLRTMFQEQVVLVTGAAGSIGSELCRQVARFKPATIAGFDISETGMFYIDREMRRSFPEVHFEPMIGSVQSYRRILEVLEAFRPAIVFHAAAYKHVPMMECHIYEAIENNIVGTYNVASAAGRSGARVFVMISSDKAVRPTSVMGLTKRVAEILVSSLQNGGTKYVSVRFGNVMGSSGSVIPVFKQQIASGGPVTVTHPEMRRYFMTIPEAAQLVLQSSTMGKGGEIFVLDMGQPIRIVDLARNMILLSGLRPDEDIRIEFTGIRPGEKISEELSAADEETRPTYHEKIRIFAGNGLHIPDAAAWIEEIRLMSAARDPRLVIALKDLVYEYNPSSVVLRHVLESSALRMDIGSDGQAPVRVRYSVAG